MSATPRHVLATLATVVLLAGCTSTSSPPATSSPPGTSSPHATVPSSPAASPVPTAQPVGSLPPYNPTIEPANFVDKITNPWFPLVPGTTFVYEGTRDGAPRRDEMTVTSETKVIMGVRCIVVRDVATSETALVEKTVDWYAQDKQGNVWYFGEDTAEYDKGVVTTTAGTWMAGVDGALPGLIMKADPKVGDAYRQEYRPGVAEDFAKVIDVNGTVEVPAGKYDRVLVTEDTDLLDRTKLENKSFAPGVGFVYTLGIVNGHREERLLSAILTAG